MKKDIKKGLIYAAGHPRETRNRSMTHPSAVDTLLEMNLCPNFETINRVH